MLASFCGWDGKVKHFLGFLISFPRRIFGRQVDAVSKVNIDAPGLSKCTTGSKGLVLWRWYDFCGLSIHLVLSFLLNELHSHCIRSGCKLLTVPDHREIK